MKKKGLYQSTISLNQIPSYQTRFLSMDKLGSVGIPLTMEKSDADLAADAEKDLRVKFASGQDQRSLPSVILRRKGVKV